VIGLGDFAIALLASGALGLSIYAIGTGFRELR